MPNAGPITEPLSLVFDHPPVCAGEGVLVLAQSADKLAPLLIPLGLLIVAVVIFGIVWKSLRDKVGRGGGLDDAAVRASLAEELRAMAKRGEVSGDEVEAIRDVMKRSLASGVGPGSTVRPPDRPGSNRDGANRPPTGNTGTSARPDERRAPPGYDLTGRPLPGGTPHRDARPPRPGPGRSSDGGRSRPDDAGDGEPRRPSSE